MTCVEPDISGNGDSTAMASSSSAADTAVSGGSSSSSKLDQHTASSDARANATPVGAIENVQRGCAVSVLRLPFIAERACPRCRVWEPFTSDHTLEKLLQWIGMPEYQRRVLGPDGNVVRELAIEDWIPDNEREEVDMAIKEQKEVRELTCKVSKAEIEDRKNKLVAVDTDINREVAERSAENAVRARTLRDLRSERDNLLGAIQNGVEKRKVDCFWRQNDRLHKKELIRADTGAVVEDEPQTLDDKQEDLFDRKPSKKAKAAEQIAAEQKKVDAGNRARAKRAKAKKNGAESRA